MTETPQYRDSAGKTLADYPRPSVAVDTAVLTVTDDGLLSVLLIDDGERRLPGTFVHPGETLADAALRALRTKAGVDGLAPRQLHVFDDPSRDDRGWVMSVAHYDVVPSSHLSEKHLLPVDALPPLPFDHEQIVAHAVAALRTEYGSTPDPRGLVEQPFTMRELRRLHEAVAGRPLQPDTFRRAMLPGLAATGAVKREGRGRPAELYSTLGDTPSPLRHARAPKRSFVDLDAPTIGGDLASTVQAMRGEEKR
ncbi:NUDIX hydrolase [Microbacterium sp. NPDC003461]